MQEAVAWPLSAGQGSMALVKEASGNWGCQVLVTAKMPRPSQSTVTTREKSCVTTEPRGLSPGRHRGISGVFFFPRGWRRSELSLPPRQV